MAVHTDRDVVAVVAFAEQHDAEALAGAVERAHPGALLALELPHACERLEVHRHGHRKRRHLLDDLAEVRRGDEGARGARLGEKLHGEVRLDPRDRVDDDPGEVRVGGVVRSDGMEELLDGMHG